jgi:enoyl-CoA hydratase/carnithine racemase
LNLSVVARSLTLYTLDKYHVQWRRQLMGSISGAEDDPRVTCQTDSEGVALIRITRPEKRNAMALSMWVTMGSLFRRLDDDPAVRCVILTGDGGHFSAGADIAEFGEVRANAAQGLEYDRINDETTLAIRNCRKPAIAAISGVAVGGGLALALACDFRVADATARMGIPAGRLGLVYSVLDCRLLAERVGVTHAKEILFSGSIVGIDDAARLGLIDRRAEGDVLGAARTLAAEFTRNAPLSIAGNKAILNAIANGTAPGRMAELERWIADAFDSEDYAEGQRAFAERRAPRFTGR